MTTTAPAAPLAAHDNRVAGRYPPPACWIAVSSGVPDSAVYGAGDSPEVAINAAVARPIAVKGRSNYRALLAELAITPYDRRPKDAELEPAR